MCTPIYQGPCPVSLAKSYCVFAAGHQGAHIFTPRLTPANVTELAWLVS